MKKLFNNIATILMFGLAGVFICSYVCETANDIFMKRKIKYIEKTIGTES